MEERVDYSRDVRECGSGAIIRGRRLFQIFPSRGGGGAINRGTAIIRKHTVVLFYIVIIIQRIWQCIKASTNLPIGGKLGKNLD